MEPIRSLRGRVMTEDPKALLRTLAAGNFFRRSLPCARLFRIEPRFLTSLATECGTLAREHQGKSWTHAESQNHPYGDTVQLCLLNRSGRLDDTSDTHDLTTTGKRFHHAERFEHLARFIAAFPDACNMRLNIIGRRSGLSLHKESTLHAARTRGAYTLRARFHLPLQTNRQARMQIGRDVYHFPAGELFFFHNGMVHAAANGGDAPRHHLVWDMMLTREATAMMFGDVQAPPFLERLPPEGWNVRPISSRAASPFEVVDGFRTVSLYHQLKLARLGIARHQFCVWYLRAASLRPRRIAFAPSSPTGPAPAADRSMSR